MIDYLSSLSNIEIVALTIYGEVRGEALSGQVAVGNVIKNRAVAYHDTYENVCLKPKQFSCWNTDDPNRILLDEIAAKLINGQSVGDLHFEQCLWIAQGIIDSKIIDNTHRALHYLTNTLFYSAQKPFWAKNSILAQQIGTQIFFNVSGEV